MKAFAALYLELDASTSTLHKVDAMARYLRAAPPEDAAWAVYFLAGGKPRQLVPSSRLRELAASAAGIPAWLFEESYAAVGDLAETIAHLVPDGMEDDLTGLAEWMNERLLPVRDADPDIQSQRLLGWWAHLDWNGRFVMNKLITGGLRVGVSKLLVARALAEVAGIDHKTLAQRMIGYTDPRTAPDADRFRALISPIDSPQARAQQRSHPYPFFLAHPLTDDLAQLGPASDWLVEWKWDGIRAQLVLRDGGCSIWSRGEELLTERLPEIEQAARQWVSQAGLGDSGVVLDGEVLAWDATQQRPLPFAALQKRIGRQRISASLLRQTPVIFVAYDLLEWGGEDWRDRPLQIRRRQLVQSLGDEEAAWSVQRLCLSPALNTDPLDWAGLAQHREAARGLGAEGLMLKHSNSSYGVGRTRTAGGLWWKWKLDPFSVDAVLIYAQRGHGRRASLYSDYTFAVWERQPDAEARLLPFAKAYSGLTDEEMKAVDAIIRRTTIESFGPVRSVTPSLVFEIGFEAIALSPRHKSGIAVRFPRILRWRQDKTIEQADSIESLRDLLLGSGAFQSIPAGVRQ